MITRLILQKVQELLQELYIVKLEGEIHIEGEYEKLVKLYQILTTLEIKCELHKEYKPYGYKTYKLIVYL